MKNLKAPLRSVSLLSLILLAWMTITAYAQITPLGDSYTNTADPTTNYGAKTLLDVDGATQITYIQFNLASIPTTASISQATLKLYVNAVTKAGSFNVDYVNDAWAEGTIDASNAPALGTTIVSNVALTTADKNQYILINVTAAVQAWLSGSETNNGIALVANGTFNATFDSKESTTTSHPAELDIAFAGGDGTITGVTTASGSGLTGGGTSGTLNLSLTDACAATQVLQWNGSAWACAAVGTGTITGVTAGTDLTGGGTSGNVTLNLNTTALNSAYAQLGVANTFAPQQVIKGNGGNAIIGDPGCGSGFSGIGLTSSTLSGCLNYTMIGKSSGDVYLNSMSSGYIHFRNGNSGSDQYNDLATIDNTGNLTAAGTVVGTASSSGAYGVTGVVTATTGTTAGVRGESSSISGYGVLGSSANVGVYGQYSGASKNGAGSGLAGVWGDTGAPSDNAFGGVLGTADDNSAAQFLNNSPAFATVYANNSATASGTLVFQTTGPILGDGCVIDIFANLTCSGTVKGVVQADGGARQVSLYAMQSPENWFEDFGSGVLTNGAMAVPLDPIFASTVNTAIDYHVFLTARGECEGLYVTNLTPSGFEVRELHHGSSNVAFDYRVVAKRAGYENQRLDDVTERYQKMREQEEKRRERMQQLRAARVASALPVPPATRAIAPIAAAGGAPGPIPLHR
jgi:hypothetical protein